MCHRSHLHYLNAHNIFAVFISNKTIFQAQADHEYVPGVHIYEHACFDKDLWRFENSMKY